MGVLGSFVCRRSAFHGSLLAPLGRPWSHLEPAGQLFLVAARTRNLAPLPPRHFGCSLGIQCASLGSSWASLVSPWAPLGPPWAPFGLTLTVPWDPVASPWLLWGPRTTDFLWHVASPLRAEENRLSLGPLWDLHGHSCRLSFPSVVRASVFVAPRVRSAFPMLRRFVHRILYKPNIPHVGQIMLA